MYLCSKKSCKPAKAKASNKDLIKYYLKRSVKYLKQAMKHLNKRTELMNNIEKKYVHDTYQLIASDFDTTRTYLWQGVKDFLDSIEKNSIILEIG